MFGLRSGQLMEDFRTRTSGPNGGIEPTYLFYVRRFVLATSVSWYQDPILRLPRQSTRRIKGVATVGPRRHALVTPQGATKTS